MFWENRKLFLQIFELHNHPKPSLYTDLHFCFHGIHVLTCRQKLIKQSRVHLFDKNVWMKLYYRRRQISLAQKFESGTLPLLQSITIQTFVDASLPHEVYLNYIDCENSISYGGCSTSDFYGPLQYVDFHFHCLLDLLNCWFYFIRHYTLHGPELKSQLHFQVQQKIKITQRICGFSRLQYFAKGALFFCQYSEKLHSS